MRILVALGGNALLRRGEAPSIEAQRANVRAAAKALLPLLDHHQVTITHGNGPQVGLLALQTALHSPSMPLDVLDAESEGMIGYLIEQELNSHLPPGRVATLLTQTLVEETDPAFQHPTKPIGPVYDQATAEQLAVKNGWAVAPDGKGFRRVVASPRPLHVLEEPIISLLLANGITVICGGGGGIPVVQATDGTLRGVEAVVDKDLTSALLAEALRVDVLLILSDVDGIYDNWGGPNQVLLRRLTSAELQARRFPDGSMGPKAAAACAFASRPGRFAVIGNLMDAEAMLKGEAGTRVSFEVS